MIGVVIVLYVNAIVPRTSARSVAFPALLQRAGKNAIFADDEFFSLQPPHPPRLCPSRGALSRLEEQGIELRQVTPGLAGRFVPHYLASVGLKYASTGHLPKAGGLFIENLLFHRARKLYYSMVSF